MVQVPDRHYLIALSAVPNLGPVRMRRLLSFFGTPEAAWSASATALRAAGLEEKIAGALVDLRRSLDPATLLDRLERTGTRALVQGDAEFPARLVDLPSAPLILYARGTLLPADEQAVAIVGTRRATTYGREVTRRIAADLAAAGVTVVSGLARGIDAAAHQATLSAGGRTIAVLGCGLDITYPPEHGLLAEQIAASGALISEYPPGTPPDAPHFPARNRLISGLSLGVLVIEAPAKSGALITVGFALDQGREVFAVPGSVLAGTSDGCHALIRDGALLVTSAAEVLEALNLVRREAQAAVRQLPLGDNEAERTLIQLLSSEPIHVDDLGRASQLPISTLNATLTIMELKGLVRQAGTMSYVLA
jgi:DNA processing protein